MRQSTLAFICGFLLFIILAYSWCGRTPQTQVAGLSPTPTPLQSGAVVSATPTVTPSASVAVAQASPTTPTQRPPQEFQKVAHKAARARRGSTVCTAKGE